LSGLAGFLARRELQTGKFFNGEFWKIAPSLSSSHACATTAKHSSEQKLTSMSKVLIVGQIKPAWLHQANTRTGRCSIIF
jgi:hypothetical protein